MYLQWIMIELSMEPRLLARFEKNYYHLRFLVRCVTEKHQNKFRTVQKVDLVTPLD